MKVKIAQTAFTGGEIGPELFGRVDLPFYVNSVKKAENCHTVVQGGIVSAPGTMYIGETATQTSANRLIPFIYSTTSAYVLEVSNTQIRFLQNGEIVKDAGVPVVLSMPNGLKGDASKLVFVQQDNFLLLWRTDGAGIYRLSKLTPILFTLSPVSFQVPPIDEVGETRFNTTFILTGTTLDAATAAFETADVGRQIKLNDGLLQITGFTSSIKVTVSVLSAPTSGTIASAYSTDFVLLDSPQTKITPTGDVTVGGTITLTATAAAFKNTAQMSHIGMFVEINSGIIEITSVTSSTVVVGVVRKTMTGLANAFAGSWSIKQSLILLAYAATPGPGKIVDHFKSGCSFEGRLVLGGTSQYPNRLTMSASGEYLNFATGVNDNDAISRDLDGYDQILHVVPSNRLYVFTYAAEYAVSGSDNGPVTPLSVIARAYTSYGSSPTVQPVRAGKDVVIVQRIGQRVRGYSYQFSQDDFEAPDFTVRHPTITGAGVVRLVYSDAPYQIMWAVLADGSAALMCVDRPSGTYAWSTFKTDGVILDAASLPESSGDSVYLFVKRNIAGADKYMVERVDYQYSTHCGIKDDSPINYPLNDDGTLAASFGYMTAGPAIGDGQTLGLTSDGGSHVHVLLSAGALTTARFSRSAAPIGYEAAEVTNTGGVVKGFVCILITDAGGALVNAGTVQTTLAGLSQIEVAPDGTVSAKKNGSTSSIGWLFPAGQKTVGATDKFCPYLAANENGATAGDYIEIKLITYVGVSSATWPVAHLDTETVDILADDVPMNQEAVTSGNVTLPRNASSVEIGLPFTSTITLLPAEFAAQDGSIMGEKAQLSSVMLRLVRTRGLSVNGEQVLYRQLDEPILDAPTLPFTGDKVIGQMGWEENQKEITITRTQPLAFHISAIKRTMQVN